MLTVIPIFCRCLGWFPVWLLLLSLAPPAAMLPAMGILLGGSLLSTFCGRLLWLRFPYKKQLAFRLSKLLMLILAALCAGGCMLTGAGPAISILLAAATCIGTNRHLNAAPDQIFTVNSYATFLTAMVIASILLAAAHLPAHGNLVLGTAGIISALYFLLRNQFMLRRFIARRSSTDADVPQDIRRGNLMLVTGVIVLIAAAFLFRTQLVSLLTWLHHGLQQIVYAFFRFLFHIAEQFEGNPADAVEEVIEEEPALSPPVPGKTNPLWLLLWIPVIAVAYKIWREFLSDWVYDIRMLLLDFIARLRKSDQEGEIRRSESADFYDTETNVAREKSDRSKQRTWRRDLRRWQSMPDGREKFYAGYRLLLEAPGWQEHPPLGADTVREIREKWAAYYTPKEALDAVTADFHADRYAECGLPPEAIADLDKALRCIRNIHHA